MADQSIYMDTDAVRKMSATFQTISGALGQINTALEQCANSLNTIAFVGLVGANAVAQYIDAIRPRIEEAAEKSEEFSKDLEASAKAYENGDATGSTRFH